MKLNLAKAATYTGTTIDGVKYRYGWYESGRAFIAKEDELMTVKIKEFMALYNIVDIRMRMLKVNELKRIMGFPSDYVLIGTQSEQKKFIGNAVEVNMAKALAETLAKCIRA